MLCRPFPRSARRQTRRVQPHHTDSTQRQAMQATTEFCSASYYSYNFCVSANEKYPRKTRPRSRNHHLLLAPALYFSLYFYPLYVQIISSISLTAIPNGRQGLNRSWDPLTFFEDSGMTTLLAVASTPYGGRTTATAPQPI